MMLFRPYQSWSETMNLKTARVECVCVGINTSRLYLQVFQTMLIVANFSPLMLMGFRSSKTDTQVSLCFVIVVKVV